MSFLDKYTKIDDLLRQNQLSLKQLIDAQIDTNKLLAALLSGRQVAIPQNLSQGVVGVGAGDIYQTKVKNFPNYSAQGTSILMDEQFGGILAEMYLISAYSGTNNIYGLKITTDNVVNYDDTFDNYSIRSDYERDVTAFYNDDYYILQVQSVMFLNSIKIEIINNEAAFTHIYIKIHEKVK